MTLLEEVIAMLLVGILIVTVSGMLLSTMRILTRNVMTLGAQERGLAVMEQLENHLEYAMEIQTTGLTDSSPYQVTLYLAEEDDKQLLKAESKLDSYANGSFATATNTLCDLGKYAVQITVSSANADASALSIFVQVSRNGTAYYTEQREVALQNKGRDGFVSGISASTSYTMDATNRQKLYIGSLE
jgi:type II secretory pathway component PulJ